MNLIENVLVNRFVSIPTYAQELGVCPNTIRRRLKTVGLHHRIPAKKPELTERHKRQRMNFAANYLNFNFEDTVFVDEKVFQTNEHGRLTLYRPNNTRYDERNVLPNRTSGRISLAFWGWISASGPGELVEIPGRLNANNYREVLQEVLIPTVESVFGNGTTIKLLQDGSSVHNSRIVQTWINEQENIELIRLPPKSPDLNPIENMWAMMVQNWDPSIPRNMHSLTSHVFQLRDYYRGLNYCEKLVSSMRSRLQTVLDARGSYTKY